MPAAKGYLRNEIGNIRLWALDGLDQLSQLPYSGLE